MVAAVDDPASGRDIPVDVRGTAFQERVWQELRRIPPGETDGSLGGYAYGLDIKQKLLEREGRK